MQPTTRVRLLFGAAAFISFLFSVSLWFSGHEKEGMFVGLRISDTAAFHGFRAEQSL